jgi:hypothetical protein
MFPNQNLLVVAANADWGQLEPGQTEAKMNQVQKLIVSAVKP